MAEASNPDPAAPRRREGTDPSRLSAREWLLLLVLAAVQFAHIVDFMLIMPLGSMFLNAATGDALHLTAPQFGLVVSAYTLSAGAASLLAARFLDRFDRKTALLVLGAGFTLGTLLCAAATTYPLLLAARAVAGAFGGVCGANVLAIIGDAFPDSRRGTATGVVMTAFSIASIAGVPLGLYLAELLDWRAPFAVLAGLSAAVLALAAWVLPPLRGHLGRRRDDAPVSAWAVATDPNHLRAFALMASLVAGSFLLFPYLAAYLVANVGLAEGDLKFMYVFGGLATLLTLTRIGRLADRVGKLPVFRVLAVATGVAMGLVAVLPAGLGLVGVLPVTTLLFVASSGRMVPGMALMTASAAPRVRGSFMSLNSAVQQLGAGLASWVGGLLLAKGEGGRLDGYPLLGALACAAAVASYYLAGRLRPAADGASAPDAAATGHDAGPDDVAEAVSAGPCRVAAPAGGCSCRG